MNEKKPESAAFETGRRVPVLFVGHGSPMNAIEDNEWSRAFHGLAEKLSRPKAILSVSAHWFVPGTFVTANEHPPTIHDFSGFPKELFEIQYPAPGAPAVGARVTELLQAVGASARGDWGLDHGTWSVLRHLWPQADIPVVQLSIDYRLPPAEHLEIGRRLSVLRDEGVLVFASGNITHNLRHAMASYRTGDRKTPAWASEVDTGVAEALSEHDATRLTRVLDTDAGRQAHPSPDHYLPLLYAAGAAEHDPVHFPITGFDAGSLSMRSVLFG